MNLNLEANTVYVGDCVDVMKTFPDASIDLVFADPPYRMDRGTGVIQRPEGGTFEGITDGWDKFETLQHYITFTQSWIFELRRLMKPVSSLWVIGDYHCIHTIGHILMEQGWSILNDVFWIKPNPVPQMRGARFCNSVETLIWAVPDRKHKYTFNYHLMKELNGGKQMRADWHGISICIGKERLRDENGNKKHSTQKPMKLIERIIQATTNEGDIVLDPFFGSGTTGAVAKKLGRQWVGIERLEHYADIAIERISNV